MLDEWPRYEPLRSVSMAAKMVFMARRLEQQLEDLRLRVEAAATASVRVNNYANIQQQWVDRISGGRAN
jgi:hypothetical protein